MNKNISRTSENMPSVIRGDNKIHYSRFHPIKFAQYCWCRECDRIVNRVVTQHHSRGPEYGDWKMQIICHDEAWQINFSAEAVQDYLAGHIAPVLTEFFGGKDPEPVSADRVRELVHRGDLGREFLGYLPLEIEEKK